jgi:rare lipoprotein A
MRKILLVILLFTFSFISPVKIHKGVASYYGKNYTGRLTASGERFHKDSLTAAHKTFKFGTIVKVINLLNDSVRFIKINDRLPSTSKRIIDLSYGAAEELNFIGRGVVPVSIEIIDTIFIKK